MRIKRFNENVGAFATSMSSHILTGNLLRYRSDDDVIKNTNNIILDSKNLLKYLKNSFKNITSSNLVEDSDSIEISLDIDSKIHTKVSIYKEDYLYKITMVGSSGQYGYNDFNKINFSYESNNIEDVYKSLVNEIKVNLITEKRTIRRFTESEYDKVSTQIGEEQVKDIISAIENIDKSLSDNKNTLTELSKLLSNYKSEENKNNQIDDSSIKLQQSISDIEGLISNLDDVNSKLKNYLEEGSQYLY